MQVNPQLGEYLYLRLKKAQRDLGMARLEIGTILSLIEQNEVLWKGRAASFPAFLEEERIQYNGAKQFMKVAKKFVLDLALSNAELEEISTANFRILELAAKIATPENKDEIVALVGALGERDARAALEDMAEGEETTLNVHAVAKSVRSLMRKFHELPDDYRSSFLSKVAPNNARRSQPDQPR